MLESKYHAPKEFTGELILIQFETRKPQAL